MRIYQEQRKACFVNRTRALRKVIRGHNVTQRASNRIPSIHNPNNTTTAPQTRKGTSYVDLVNARGMPSFASDFMRLQDAFHLKGSTSVEDAHPHSYRANICAYYLWMTVYCSKAVSLSSYRYSPPLDQNV